MYRNDNLRKKTTNRSETYSCTMNEEAYSLNAKIEAIVHFFYAAIIHETSLIIE